MADDVGSPRLRPTPCAFPGQSAPSPVHTPGKAARCDTLSMETTSDGSPATRASVEYQGWKIILSPDPGGPFGRRSVLATAAKGETRIAAQAWNPDMAREMIQDMIRRREK